MVPSVVDDSTWQWGQRLSQLHCSGPTSRTLLERLTGESLIKRLVVAGQRLEENGLACGVAE